MTSRYKLITWYQLLVWEPSGGDYVRIPVPSCCSAPHVAYLNITQTQSVITHIVCPCSFPSFFVFSTSSSSHLLSTSVPPAERGRPELEYFLSDLTREEVRRTLSNKSFAQSIHTEVLILATHCEEHMTAQESPLKPLVVLTLTWTILFLLLILWICWGMNIGGISLTIVQFSIHVLNVLHTFYVGLYVWMECSKYPNFKTLPYTIIDLNFTRILCF